MSEVNWALGLNQTNPGQAFQQAYEQGMARRREMATREAMGKLATNPDDEGAFQALASADPNTAMQFRNQRQTQHQAQLEQHRESIITGGKIFRQFNVKDEATYQQARNAAAQMGVDVTQVPPNYDPAYVQGVVQMAEAMAPQAQDRAPSSVQEFEYAKSQGFGGDYMAFMEEKRGDIVANNGDGTFTIVPRGMIGGGQPPQTGGALPPPPPGFQLDGGPTPPASGNFP